MPHTLYDVPVCQQCISPLDYFAERVTVNNEVIGLSQHEEILTLCTTHKQTSIQQ